MSAIIVDRPAENIARVTISRPEAHNAVNGEITRALEAAVDATESDNEIRVIVLTGAGQDTFCAGADLKDLAAGRRAELRTDRGGFAGFVFRDRSKPWIAAVNGRALAGGAELALACDLIVAADHATFALPEVKRGLIAAAGGLYRLPRAIPPKIALELLLTAEAMDAGRAYQFGLVNRLVPGSRLQEAALEMATAIALNAPMAVRESLSIASQANDLDEAALRARSRDAVARIASGEDFKEGPRSFIEKRAPRWIGR